MTDTIDRRPTRLGTVGAVLLATVVLLLALAYSVTGAVVAGVGLVVIGIATITGWRGGVDLAGLLLTIAIIVAGLAAPPPSESILSAVIVLAGAIATVLAWDVGTNAIDMGIQLGREGDTARAEVSHAVGSLTVGVVVVTASLAVFQMASGGQPVSALAVMLIAMLVLISALRL